MCVNSIFILVLLMKRTRYIKPSTLLFNNNKIEGFYIIKKSTLLILMVFYLLSAIKELLLSFKSTSDIVNIFSGRYI